MKKKFILLNVNNKVMIPLIILIVLRTIKLTLAAWLNGEEVEVSFLANLFKLVVDSLLIWWLVESFKS
jgi:hypothetical protein